MTRPGEMGFTLFEMLIVMAIVGIAMLAVSGFQGSGANVQAKSTAVTIASKLRELRASAMSTVSERVATIDTNSRTMRFGDGRNALKLHDSIAFDVISAESERRTVTSAGVRFFPNGSSSGATIRLQSERQAYEVRVNWLTGRVSTRAVD